MRFAISSLLVFLMAFFAVCSFDSSASAYPKATDHAQRWQLTFDTTGLRFYRDLRTGHGYWVMVYEVTNETRSDQHWVPSFTLVTDQGEMLDAGNDVPRRIHTDILDTFGDPLLQMQSEVRSALHRGEENAIRGLVVWKAKNEDARSLQVFVSGVSGDTAKVRNPISGEEVVLHRELQLSWVVPGALTGDLKPLPRREVGGGVSVRRLSNEEVEAAAEDQVYRRWVFR
ncbi:MAG: hypothetical protein QGI78_08390 [Phycisphaerales bacterium]|jgi:hypothetical protein|nr:hypothetical protein [Phycisphaerales bacterium]